MSPGESDTLNRHLAGMDDWRVRCPNCDTTIVGTVELIQAHAEACRG
jgi:hypothetical protein